MQTLEQRFWKHVNKTDTCWLWTGTTDSFGYGTFWLIRGKKRIQAHRFSWILAHGPIIDDQCRCHTCDIPACVRPDHLFLGTTGENIKDAVRKNRHAKGERMGSAVLKNVDVLQLKELAPFVPRSRLYNLFPQVAKRTIRDILTEKPGGISN